MIVGLWTEKTIERALSGYRVLPTLVNPRGYADAREVPRYSLREVALYFRLNPRTVHTWFFGRSYRVGKEKRFWKPLAIPAAHDPHGFSLSFYNLAEAHVLSCTRHDFNISVRSIRIAMDELAKIYPNIRHPLLTKDFETNGTDLFIRVLEKEGEELIVNLTRYGQLGLKPVLDMYLKRIVRDHFEKPTRVFPVLDHNFKEKPIVISQGVAGGRPTITGSGVRVAAVWNRYRAGETTQELAEDYGINEESVKTAISYFSDVRAA